MKGVEIHSSVPAWGIPWTEEPGGLQSAGLQRVGCDRSDFAHTGCRAMRAGEAPEAHWAKLSQAPAHGELLAFATQLQAGVGTRGRRLGGPASPRSSPPEHSGNSVTSERESWGWGEALGTVQG